MDVGIELEAVTSAVQGKFSTAPPEVVRRLVADGFRGYEGAAIHSFVPVLVQRDVEARLRAERDPSTL